MCEIPPADFADEADLLDYREGLRNLWEPVTEI